MNATLISIFAHREVAPIERTTGDFSHSGPSYIRPGVASGRGPHRLVRVGRGNARL